MKKKLFAGLVTAALSAAMCVSLIGCGDGGAADAKDIEGVEVTAQQWTAAFEALAKDDAVYHLDVTTSFKVTVKMTDPETEDKLTGTSMNSDAFEYSKKGGKEYLKETVTTEFSGDARRISEIMGASAEEMPEEDKTTVVTEQYTEKTNDGYVIYEQDEENEGAWKTSNHGYSLCPAESMLDEYQDQYAQFTYNAEQKGYIPSDYSAEEEGELVVIKFDAEGRLVAIYTIESEEEGEGDFSQSAEYEFSYVFTYEVDDITLPVVNE